MENRWPYCLLRQMMMIWNDLSSATRRVFRLFWRNPGKKSNKEKACQVRPSGKPLTNEAGNGTRQAEDNQQRSVRPARNWSRSVPGTARSERERICSKIAKGGDSNHDPS